MPVTAYDMEQNRGRSRLWLLSEQGAPRPLTSEEHSSTEPCVSPDGTRVAFVRAQGEEKSQVYVLPLDGGEAERLTDMPLGVFDPRWFPDGRRLAFGAWHEVRGSALQLVLNLTGMALAGWVALALQQVVWSRVSQRRARLARRLRPSTPVD